MTHKISQNDLPHKKSFSGHSILNFGIQLAVFRKSENTLHFKMNTVPKITNIFTKFIFYQYLFTSLFFSFKVTKLRDTESKKMFSKTVKKIVVLTDFMFFFLHNEKNIVKVNKDSNLKSFYTNFTVKFSAFKMLL